MSEDQTMEEKYLQQYILNDALCPAQVSGPRILVGYWAIEDVPYGVKPETPDEPMFTIMYPVGRGTEPYNWRHIDPNDKDHLEHPNSANNIEWVDGHLRYDQSTEYACRTNLGNLRSPNTKTSHWELFRDMPDYLFGRIFTTWELSDVVVREKSKICFRAPDGHYIHASEKSQHGLHCARRILDHSCYFRARFPNYVWNEEGGSGDEGAFYLEAPNKNFVRAVSAPKDGMRLQADAKLMADATLFSAQKAVGGMMSLSAENEEGSRLTLKHDPPYGDLRLVSEPDPTWAWFGVSYA